MKHIFFFIAALISFVTASAQISAFKQGSSASIEGYSLPRTVLTVKITQERETILRGPYARYASQYLGIVAAPMSDKESCKIVSAQIGFYEEPDPKQVFVFDEKSGNPAKVFNWLTLAAPQKENIQFKKERIDFILPFKDLGVDISSNGRLSAVEKSQEQMAADAADVIYRIRKKRIELVTGDIGEGVYGEGLKAALEEMDKIESEYMSLFIGKRQVEVTTKYFTTVPEVGKNRVTVCRFSDTKGVVADTDLSGRPINIELANESAVASSQSFPNNSKKPVRTVVYRIPQMSIAKLTDGQEVLSNLRVPIYQAGSLVEMPIVFGL